MLIGLVGQLAWTVENMYLNVFVYETITDDPTVIAVLVAASAITAALTTMVVGAWSDRVGRRRPFITSGYVLWGLATAAFGLITVDPSSAGAVAAAVAAVIALDCLMTVFGSTANDAAYQAWVTDVTTPAIRGRVDSVVQVLPLVAMLIVFVALDPLTKDGHWLAFFGTVGAAVLVVGVASHFLVTDVPHTPAAPQESYLAAVVSGLRPTAVRRNPLLYLTLAVWAVWGISTQVFMPFLLIYLDHYLHLAAYALVLGGALIGASVLTILSGRLIDRFGKARSLLPAMAINLVGLLAFVPSRSSLTTLVTGTVLMTGFMLTVACLAAISRDLTPDGQAGHVQGLRMIFAILLPMVIGPFIGAAVIAGNNERYVDLGVSRVVPTPAVFVASAVVLVLAAVPAFMLRRRLLR